MLSLSQLKAFALAASFVASGQTRHLKADVAEAMARAALANPIIEGDDTSTKQLVAIEVAIAWHEGGLLLDPVIGGNDHGQSHCWAQIHLPNGARTREGWTGAELRADPNKCARVAVRLIKASLSASPSCNFCGLTVYARGRDTEEGRRLSRVRMELAVRLARDVPVPAEDDQP